MYIYIYVCIYVYIFYYIYKVFTYNVYNVSFKNKLLLKKVSTAVCKKFSSKIQMGYKTFLKFSTSSKSSTFLLPACFRAKSFIFSTTDFAN